MCSPPQDKTPSMLARYTTASILTGILSVWCYFSFPSRDATPGLTAPMHSYHTPLALVAFYLVSLPSLKWFTEKFLAPRYDMKLLLTESMVIYNVAQVALNGWCVYEMINAVVNRGHPFVGSRELSGPAVASGASYAIWVHYCDKYLEFFDTYFMVLRGKMNQVSFLHIYHHATIAMAWWTAITYAPGGDIYFGGLLNSLIHVLMYSYYALALLKVSCPWKRFLTQAQLIQFTSVVVYSLFSVYYQYQNYPHEAVEGERISLWQYYFCVVVQDFEMISLFFLFTMFYKRSYAKKNKGGKGGSEKSSLSKDDDQCHKAMGEISEGAKEVVSHAAKDVSKLVGAVKRNNGKSSLKAM